jgi:hypothetical protein
LIELRLVVDEGLGVREGGSRWELEEEFRIMEGVDPLRCRCEEFILPFRVRLEPSTSPSCSSSSLAETSPGIRKQEIEIHGNTIDLA